MIPSRTVHPHVRGADVCVFHYQLQYGRFIPTCVGQILFSYAENADFSRFIPTCVGQIKPTPDFFVFDPVHPHVRGADETVIRLKLAHGRFIPTCVGQMVRIRSEPLKKAGSSPRAWGRCFHSLDNSHAAAVHPHVRGADFVPWFSAQAQARFIPTCVGQIKCSFIIC